MAIAWTLLPATPLTESPVSGGCCNCCVNTLDLGCFNACAPIYLKGVLAPLLGYYSFVFQTPAGERTIKVYLQIGAPLVCPNPFEFGDSTFYITDPNGERIEIQSVETIVDACAVSTDYTNIYDCFRITSKIESATVYENVPCTGFETVFIERIAQISRKGASRSEVLLSNVPDLFVVNTAHFEIYRLYYSPQGGCILGGDVSILVTSGNYSVSNTIHIAEPSDPINLPYIQFEITANIPGTLAFPLQLTILGLCNGCALPVVYDATIIQYDCGDPNPFLYGFSKDSEIFPNPHIVADDLSFENLLLTIFRQCCTENISVDIQILASTSTDFTLPLTLVIPAGDADVPITINYPDGAFTASIQVTLTGCSIITTFFQTFQR